MDCRLRRLSGIELEPEHAAGTSAAGGKPSARRIAGEPAGAHALVPLGRNSGASAGTAHRGDARGSPSRGAGIVGGAAAIPAAPQGFGRLGELASGAADLPACAEDVARTSSRSLGRPGRAGCGGRAARLHSTAIPGLAAAGPVLLPDE